MKKIAILIALLFVSAYCSVVSAAPIEAPQLSAYAAVLMDAETGQIVYSSHENEQLPMASTTKILTSLIAIEYGQPDLKLTVTKEMLNVEGTAIGLRAGDTVTLDSLISGMLLASGNDAANVAAFAVCGSLSAFAEVMNRRAAEIGMTSSHFVTPSGLDAEGHYSTAYDMALLAAEALKNEDFAQRCSAKKATLSFGAPPSAHTVYNHNKLLDMYEYSLGIKTGFTKKSGRCLVSAAEKDGVKLVAVTLNAPDDWNDHISLFEYGFAAAKRVRLNTSFSADIRVPVGGGTESFVSPRADTVPDVTIYDNGIPTHVTRELYLSRLLLAPVIAGEQLGTAVYSIGDKVIYRLPLYAASGVEADPAAPGFAMWLRKLTAVVFS